MQDYAACDPAGRDLQPFVDLVDAHGPDAILAAVDQLTDEEHANVTVNCARQHLDLGGLSWVNARPTAPS